MANNGLSVSEKIQKLATKVNTDALIDRSLVDWRPILSKECQVYVCGENYIAKRFDQIHYQFCDKDTAKDILVDNLYALLRFNYFQTITDDVDDRIEEIIKYFTRNLKSTLIKVSFDEDSDSTVIRFLPNGCVAFRNGVFNFKTNNWLFKYQITKIPSLTNTIYLYDPTYAIMWYVNIDFEPLDVDINETSLKDFLSIMTEIDKANRLENEENKNYCLELMWNMAHDSNDTFSFDRFNHLCEVLGYACLQSFSQLFVLFIGAGQNGKNSLFDGCFSHKVVPTPTNNSLDALENDRFITGTLENKSHNIFLETSAKTYTDSQMLKLLTGSMYQTIENKGSPKRSGIINCKYIWSGNDQDKVKFSDTTPGFRRRINIIEIFYQWDKEKHYMANNPDYYDISYSDDLNELKRDNTNIISFIYFAMYGILSATKNFQKNFQFTSNDWKLKYSDIDFELKDVIESINNEKLYNYLKNPINKNSNKYILFDLTKKVLHESYTMKEFGINNYTDMLEIFKNDEDFTSYFSENDIYITREGLQYLCGRSQESSTTFTDKIKKLYGLSKKLQTVSSNKSVFKVRFRNNKMIILGD